MEIDKRTLAEFWLKQSKIDQTNSLFEAYITRYKVWKIKKIECFSLFISNEKPNNLNAQ